jgi:hypothetical protein
MKQQGYIAIAIVLASLAGACGAGGEDTQPRQQNPNLPRQNVGPSPDMGPPPQNMPGGGRGSEPPHFKGKP